MQATHWLSSSSNNTELSKLLTSALVKYRCSKTNNRWRSNPNVVRCTIHTIRAHKKISYTTIVLSDRNNLNYSDECKVTQRFKIYTAQYYQAVSQTP